MVGESRIDQVFWFWRFLLKKVFEKVVKERSFVTVVEWLQETSGYRKLAFEACEETFSFGRFLSD